MRDPTQTDFRLWLIFSGSLAATIVAAFLFVPMSAGGLRLQDVPRIVPGLFLIILPCIVMGWFAQLMVSSCGLRLFRRSRPDQSDDYDDQPPTPDGRPN
jgi:hypothetical protein